MAGLRSLLEWWVLEYCDECEPLRLVACILKFGDSGHLELIRHRGDLGYSTGVWEFLGGIGLTFSHFFFF